MGRKPRRRRPPDEPELPTCTLCCSPLDQLQQFRMRDGDAICAACASVAKGGGLAVGPCDGGDVTEHENQQQQQQHDLKPR